MKVKHITIYNFDELMKPLMEGIANGDVKLSEEYRDKIIKKFREEIKRVCEDIISMRDEE
jgi:hypothetical protein